MEVKNLALKERPMRFEEVIGQDGVMDNLKAQSRGNKFFQTYLLYGYYGCGKTTTARILAAAVNCHHKDENGNPCGVCEHCRAVRQGCTDVMEIDGASNTGIDNIRQLKETVDYLPTVLDKKIYIIDEVHKLSDSAFNALLKVLEEPPAHVVFILATTDRDKIPATVLSRLAKYEFKRIPTDTLVGHLKVIAQRNGYTFTEEGLATIARNSDGSVRNSIKMLEIVSELDGGVTEKNAAQVIGLSDPAEVYEFLKLLLNGDARGAFYRATEMADEGWDPRRLVSELIRVCSDAVLAQERMDLVDASEQYKELLGEICGMYDCRRFIDVMDFLMSMAGKLRDAGGDRNVFKNEILIFATSTSNRIAELEAQVAVLTAKVENLIHHETCSRDADVCVTNTEPVIPKEVKEDDTCPWNEDESALEEEVSAEERPCEEQEACAVTESCEFTDPETVHDKKESTVEIDPFLILRSFSFMSGTAGVGEESVPKQEENVPDTNDQETMENLSEHVVQGADSVSVDEILTDIEENQPVLDNLLSLGFHKLQEGERTVFETDEPSFLQIGKAYAEAMGGLPFELRQAQK